MSWQIIHDDDVAATEGWCEALLDVREEDGAFHRSINQEGSDNPVVAQAGDECDCFSNVHAEPMRSAALSAGNDL